MHDVAGNHVIVPVGNAAKNYRGFIRVNEMGVVLWNLLEKDITRDEVITTILREYDVTEEQVGKDVEFFLQKLVQAGAIEE